MCGVLISYTMVLRVKGLAYPLPLVSLAINSIYHSAATARRVPCLNQRFLHVQPRILYYEILPSFRTLFLGFDGIRICQSESLKCHTETTRIRNDGLLSHRYSRFLCFMPGHQLSTSRRSQRYRSPVLRYEKHNSSRRYNLPSPRKYSMHDSRSWSKCHCFLKWASWRRNHQRRSFCNIFPYPYRLRYWW